MPAYKVIVEVTKRYEWDAEAESLESACTLVQKNPEGEDAEMTGGGIVRIIFAEEVGAQADAPKPKKPSKPRRKRRTKAEIAAAGATLGVTGD